MTEENHVGIYCDYHDKKYAVKNVQMVWSEYDVNGKIAEYSDNPEITAEPIESHHLCRSCYKEWERGELYL